jgi:hypothetical protein
MAFGRLETCVPIRFHKRLRCNPLQLFRFETCSH